MHHRRCASGKLVRPALTQDQALPRKPLSFAAVPPSRSHAAGGSKQIQAERKARRHPGFIPLPFPFHRAPC
ncbi:hypothetical protein AYM39_13700 [Methylomonas sp. DH-1]|nr:hypothetical protein AYM39_13700 [Methylomonas sp. DH-1]